MKQNNCEVKETWFPIEGFERYEISNLYRIRSNVSGKGLIMKQILKSSGYYGVTLYHKGIKKQCTMHTIIAKAFIPNPLCKPCVNHINGVKTDNKIENLEWVSCAENNLHAYRVLGRGTSFQGKKGALSHVAVPVIQMDKEGKFIKLWPSAIDACRELGVNYRRIFHVMSGRRKSTKGFKFKRA